ncbi:MAG: TonB-dependent receptor [Candidatus Cloacimonetes bacterium]|nr:TonB-dependent receptor [Candidatus Cloacimonadota bacterium]
MLQLGGVIKRNNTQELRIGSAHSFDTYSYQLGLSREHTDGFVLADDFIPTPFENGGVRNSSAKTQYNLMGSINADIFTFHKLGLDIGYSGMDKKELPASIYERRFRFYEDWKRYHATASGEFILSETLLLTNMLAFDGGGDRYLEYNDPLLQSLNVDSQMQNRSLAIAPRLRWQREQSGTWDWGFRYELQGSKRKDTSDYPDWTDNTVQNTQVFTQYEAKPLTNLLLTTAIGISGNQNDRITKPVWNLEPAVGLVFSPNSNAKTSLAVGRNSANPTLRQLFSYSKGNPYLKTQNSLKAELSHESAVVWNFINFSTSLFYNDTRDLIDLYNGRYANIYEVQSYGTEIVMGMAPLNLWSLEAEYAYLDYYKNSDYRLTETPKHSLTITNRLSLPAKSIIQLSSHYKGERFSQDDAGGYHTLSPYWRQDALFSIPWRKLKLTLGLENILDADYQGEYGFPEAGRNFSIGIEAEI